MDLASTLYAKIVLNKLTQFFQGMEKGSSWFNAPFDEDELAFEILTKMGYTIEDETCDLSKASAETERDFEELMPAEVAHALCEQFNSTASLAKTRSEAYAYMLKKQAENFFTGLADQLMHARPCYHKMEVLSDDYELCQEARDTYLTPLGYSFVCGGGMSKCDVRVSAVTEICRASDIAINGAISRSDYYQRLLKERLSCWFSKVRLSMETTRCHVFSPGRPVESGKFRIAYPGQPTAEEAKHLRPLGYVFDDQNESDLSISSVEATLESYGGIHSICENAILRRDAYETFCRRKLEILKPSIDALHQVADEALFYMCAVKIMNVDDGQMLKELCESQGATTQWIGSTIQGRPHTMYVDFKGCGKRLQEMMEAQPGGTIAEEAAQNFKRLAEIRCEPSA